MDAYVYQAALYCPGCAAHIRSRVRDKARWPDGPHPDGGGEADYPQHCDGCGLFLENPLTDDGEAYVRGAVADAERDGNGALDAWRQRYGYLFEGE